MGWIAGFHAVGAGVSSSWAIGVVRPQPVAPRSLLMPASAGRIWRDGYRSRLPGAVSTDLAVPSSCSASRSKFSFTKTSARKPLPSGIGRKRGASVTTAFSASEKLFGPSELSADGGTLEALPKSTTLTTNGRRHKAPNPLTGDHFGKNLPAPHAAWRRRGQVGLAEPCRLVVVPRFGARQPENPFRINGPQSQIAWSLDLSYRRLR